MLLLGFLLAELVLQGLAFSSGRVGRTLSTATERVVPDDLLTERPSPAVSDHDEAGWRNPRALAHAGIVALGDSQTYGDEVSQLNAWPLELGEALGVTSYNMGFSGFGPVEYYLLGPEAMAKSPEVIVVGIYSGNDMRDAYEQAVVRSRAPELVAGMLTPDELLAIDAERESLTDAWRTGRRMRRGRWKTWRDGNLEPLGKRIKLWGVVRGLARLGNEATLGARGDKVRDDFDAYAQEVATLPREYYFPLKGPHAATILTPRRGVVLRLDDPRIAAGARISVQALVGLRDRCGADCTVVAVLIPTKELVFGLEVAASGVEPPAAYRELLSDETELWRFLRAGLEAEGIEYVGVLESLRASVAAGRNPYLSDWDGHPNVTGNEVIAERVAEHHALRALRSN
jgi:hypothetical protein